VDVPLHPDGVLEPESETRNPKRFLFFFTLVTGPRRSLSLKLSDAGVYEPQMRNPNQVDVPLHPVGVLEAPR